MTWLIMDKTIIIGIEREYKIPKSQDPKNQKIPNEHSNIPYPLALFFFGTMDVTAAFNIDSCAPIPIPQRISPKRVAHSLVNPKIKSENGAEINVEIARTFTPFLS